MTAAENIERQSKVQFAAVLLGGMICLMSLIAFTLLGSGIGLITFEIEKGDLPNFASGIVGILFFGISIIGSFFIGGYVAAKLANQNQSLFAILHGIGSWALASLALFWIIGSNMASTLSSAIQQATLGVGSASALTVLFNQIRDLNPQLISDIQLTKGKVITQIVTHQPKVHNALELGEAATQETKTIAKKPQVRRETTQLAGTVRTSAGQASLAGFFSLLLSAMAAGLGAAVVNRQSATKTTA